MKKTAHLLPVRREQREYCPISTFRKTTLPVFPLRNTNVGLGSTNVVVFAKIWMTERPVKTLLPPMNVVSELGAEVVEGELVGFPVDHHLASSHPECLAWEYAQGQRASYHRVECRIKTVIGIPRNLRPSENKFLDSASNLKLLWFSKFYKYYFNI